MMVCLMEWRFGWCKKKVENVRNKGVCVAYFTFLWGFGGVFEEGVV